MAQRFYVETLGCPKNQVDSDKLIGTLLADGMTPTDDAGAADLVVVNTCAFIDEARKESIDTILALEEQRKDGARLVVTGCMAERYGDELAEALPEVDQVAGFGVPVNLGRKPLSVSACADPAARPAQPAAAEVGEPVGLRQDRRGLRPLAAGSARSRRSAARSAAATSSSILDEVDQLEAQEIVLVAQDLASYGKDRPDELGAGSIVPLVKAVSARVAVDPAAVPLPERSHRRADRRHLRHRRAVLRPVAAARQQAAAAPDAPVGRRRPVPASHRRHPRPRARRRVPQQLHRRLPGRDRGRSRPAAALRRGRPSSTGAGSSPTAPRRAPTPSASTARSSPG